MEWVEPSRPLRSRDVLNTPLASEVFAILDAAGTADLRLAGWRLS